MEERRQQSETVKAVIIVLVVLLPIVGVYASCGLFAKRFQYRLQHRYDHVTLANVSDRTGMSFPSSTLVIHSHGNSGLSDSEIFLLIEMDRRDVDGFVRGLPESEMDRGGPIVSRTDREDMKMTCASRSPDWWRPRDAKNFISVAWEGYLRYASAATMLIDLDDPKKAVVYLYYWT